MAKVIQSYSRENIFWFNVYFFLALHICALWGVIRFFHEGGVSKEVVVAAVVYFFLCHLSITVYLHRFLTHKAFQMKIWVRYVFVCLAAGTAQGQAMIWAGIHYRHHSKEDMVGDLHSPYVGPYSTHEKVTFFMRVFAFLHSFAGWAFLRSSYEVRDVARFRNEVTHPEVVWQYRYYFKLMLLMAFGVPTLLGGILTWSVGGFLEGFLIIGALRLVLQFYFTWIVNSFGHTVGERIDGHATNIGVPNSKKWWVRLLCYPFTLFFAIITVGESYHANHHVSASHWKLGREWWQFDPGAMSISILMELGLASDPLVPKNRIRTPAEKAAEAT